jgi:hypothetical protein
MIYGCTGLSYPDGTVRPLTPIAEHPRGRVWAVVVPEPIDDLVDYLARSSSPIVASWARGFTQGDRG